MSSTPGRWIGWPNVLDLFKYPVEADDQAHTVHDQPKANETDQCKLIPADPRAEAADVRDSRRWGEFVVPFISFFRARNDRGKVVVEA